MDMHETLFDDQTFRACLARLDRITADMRPQWGTMDAGQMVAHCATIQEATNGAKVEGTNFLLKLFRPMIKKLVIQGNYKRNSRTHPAFKQAGTKDFDAEKARLLAALNSFVSMGEEKAAMIEHDFFGKMTAEEKGHAMYKHLDYHLTQFGV